MMLLEVGGRLIDNGEYEKAMSLLDQSFHIVTSPSPDGIDLSSLMDWGDNNTSNMEKLDKSKQQIDMYLEDVEDV